MVGKVWKYIVDKLESEGACHFSLLDPDPSSMTIESVVEIATLAEIIDHLEAALNAFRDVAEGLPVTGNRSSECHHTQ